jgi:UDP-N-acetylglucosamine:LPS N-acetylglucosamine transferase
MSARLLPTEVLHAPADCERRTAEDEFKPSSNPQSEIRIPQSARPVLILSISNGAGHLSSARAVAQAIEAQMNAKTLIVDVAEYMNAATRFTHVTLYLWLVKYLPRVWGRIDAYQKRQPHTSPEWYYRRGCRRLFELAQRVNPRAIVATEVGCCEIAALIKRDLKLDVPLIAINVCYDADRAWVQPEVDLYTAMTDEFGQELARHGARTERIRTWGAPFSKEFQVRREEMDDRAWLCDWLKLDAARPIILLAGGAEGLGRIEETLRSLLQLERDAPQLVVLAGQNERLRKRCERLARVSSEEAGKRVRVLGWIESSLMPRLLRACDLAVSKFGNSFDEAIACELPLVALEPPPGSERAQYELLEQWGTGRAVRTLDELKETVKSLLADERERERMREQARARRQTDAGERIARWLAEAKRI